jgi:predicted Zn finger-like uncharacterized protein
MRVVCPACNAEYEVPNRLIGTGRRLRCTRCNHDWLLHPPAPTEALHPAPLPAPQPIPLSAPQPAPLSAPQPVPLSAPQPIPLSAPQPVPGLRRPPQVPYPPLPRADEPRGGLRWLAWLGSLLVIGLLLAGLWDYRAELTAAWPPMARLYDWLGLQSE